MNKIRYIFDCVKQEQEIKVARKKFISFTCNYFEAGNQRRLMALLHDVKSKFRLLSCFVFSEFCPHFQVTECLEVRFLFKRFSESYNYFFLHLSGHIFKKNWLKHTKQGIAIIVKNSLIWEDKN